MDTPAGAAGGVSASEALSRVADPVAARSDELFRHGTLQVKVYAPRGTDPQTPHARDEVYVVLSGTGTFFDGTERISDDFATWVLFYGPEGGEAAD